MLGIPKIKLLVYDNRELEIWNDDTNSCRSEQRNGVRYVLYQVEAEVLIILVLHFVPSVKHL